MTGLRLTVTRAEAALFEKHPLPWDRGGTRGANYSIFDNNGIAVIYEDSYIQPVHLAWNLCMYVRPWCFSSFIASPWERERARTWVPAILEQHRLPWRIADFADNSLFRARALTDARGRWMMTSRATDTSIDVCYQLSLLAEDVQYRQRRGLL